MLHDSFTNWKQTSCPQHIDSGVCLPYKINEKHSELLAGSFARFDVSVMLLEYLQKVSKSVSLFLIVDAHSYRTYSTRQFSLKIGTSYSWDICFRSPNSCSIMCLLL